MCFAPLASIERDWAVSVGQAVQTCLGAMTVRAAVCCEVAQRACQPIGASTMGETLKKSARVGKKAADPASAEPVLLSGGNPQIPKGYGDAPVQAYIAAMPACKSEVGRRLDAVIERA